MTQPYLAYLEHRNPGEENVKRYWLRWDGSVVVDTLNSERPTREVVQYTDLDKWILNSLIRKATATNQAKFRYMHQV